MGAYTQILIVDDFGAFSKTMFQEWLEKRHEAEESVCVGFQEIESQNSNDLHCLWFKSMAECHLGEVLAAIWACVNEEYINPGWVLLIVDGDAVEFESRPRSYFWHKEGWHKTTRWYDGPLENPNGTLR